MEQLQMCDYSLTNVASRPAKVGDKLITRNFGTGTKGFCSVDDPAVAVCLLPGTEVGFDEVITKSSWVGFFTAKQKHAYSKVAIFRQIDKDERFKHHDALEMPDGTTVLLTLLDEGQNATVLQLPAKPKNETEAKEQTRLEVVA
jgi:hypothetical protein